MNRSALWHAQHNGSRECATILIQIGLDPNYGMQSNPYGTATNPDGMITGSLANREFLTKAPANDTDAKFRRQSDVIVRRQGSAAGSSNGQERPTNGYHMRTSDAFDRLPASAI